MPDLENTNQLDEVTRTISPGVWTAVLVDADGDTIEVFHANEVNITLSFTSAVDDTGSHAAEPGDDDYPADGWRVRHRSFNPIIDGQLPGAERGRHAFERAQERADDGAREAEKRGWVVQIGTDGDDRPVWRMTQEGARRAEELMGLPVGTVPFGDDLTVRHIPT